MKKIFNLLVLIFLSFMLFITKTYAKEANVYVFYGKTCPHCHEAIEYLDSINDKYDINIIKYEVWYNDNNKKTMDNIAKYLDFNVKGVPFVIIDNTPIVGFSKGNTDNTYIYHIKKASSDDFIDLVGIKLGVVKNKSNHNNATLFGKKQSTKKSDLLTLSLVKGLIDSSHIYMILIILTFSTLLIYISNKKKSFFIGLGLCILISFLYLLSVLLNVDYTNYLNILNVVRVLTSTSLIVIGIILLIIIIKRLDVEQQVKKDNANNINKNILMITFSFIISLLLLICIFSNYNNTARILNDTISKISYFMVYMLINIIIYLLMYKAWTILKLYDKNKKYLIVINAIILILTGILLGITKIIYI